MGSDSAFSRENRSFLSKLVRFAWPLVLVVFLGILGGIGFATVIDVPRVDTLSAFSPSLITEIRDSSGTVFATFAKERRLLLSEGKVPEVVQHALLSGEDRNFLQHGGVDAEGVLRAAFKNLLQRRFIGGSTITMQLARKLFLHPKKLWRRKIEEAFLAVELEKRLSKDQILTLYCNVMFFGHGNYGIEAASQSFFGKPASELLVDEAATLIGILQRPSDYSPYRRPDLVLGRRDYVLRRMREEGYLSDADFETAVSRPLEVVTRTAEQLIAPYFAEEVRKDIEQKLGSTALLEQGLVVSTTLDREIQAASESALRNGLIRLDRRLRGWKGVVERVESETDPVKVSGRTTPNLTPGVWNQGRVIDVEPEGADVSLGPEVLRLDRTGIRWTGRSRLTDIVRPGDLIWVSVRDDDSSDPDAEARLELQQIPELEGAVLVLESASGAIRAMVGGWNFTTSKFNRATQARRQVGSAFKPFVFGAALEAGFTAADTFFDAPTAFPAETREPTYSPRNYYREYYGIATMRRALEKSMNVTAVKVMDLVGPDAVVDFAQRSGIASPLPPVPSLALGSADLTPLELASAFAAIGNQGLYVQPYLIEEISDATGRTIQSHRMQARKAMDPEIAYVLTHMLEGVVDQGTATDARHLEVDLAGKTGTTDDYSDAWFVGFTPRYTILVWVGHDAKRPIGRNMSGAVA
ncbi:MAG: PBP1A family penicillin-binding protein, partial [Acidobacteriota bacterium]|nr:PBP1A family penicillin-binding protein [Acidobacteriota bacterium]